MCFGHAAASGAVATGVATELYLAYSIGAVCKHDESIRYFFRRVPFQWVDWEALVFFQAPRIIEKQPIDRWQTFREVHNFRKNHMEKKPSNAVEKFKTLTGLRQSNYTCLGYQTQNQMIHAFLSWAKYESWHQMNNHSERVYTYEWYGTCFTPYPSSPPWPWTVQVVQTATQRYSLADPFQRNQCTKSHSSKMIPGKDEKRSIDNLGMPGNFKYLNVQLLN